MKRSKTLIKLQGWSGMVNALKRQQNHVHASKNRKKHCSKLGVLNRFYTDQSILEVSHQKRLLTTKMIIFQMTFSHFSVHTIYSFFLKTNEVGANVTVKFKLKYSSKIIIYNYIFYLNTQKIISHVKSIFFIHYFTRVDVKRFFIIEL